MGDWAGEARRLVPGDLPAAARALGVPQAALVAVLAVEASGRGFDAENRPIILYEPHVLFRQLRAHRPDKLAVAQAARLAYPRWGTEPYPRGQSAQYWRLDAACAIDPECAVRACSWGIPQILGENWQQAGYPSALAMVEAFKRSEQDQVGAMLRLIRAWGLVPALVAGDWARFARRYNGPGAVQTYSAKLAAAHRQAVARLGHDPGAPPAPVPASPALPAPPRPGRVRIYDADALNDAELARVRAGLSDADALNAAELARIRGTHGP